METGNAIHLRSKYISADKEKKHFEARQFLFCFAGLQQVKASGRDRYFDKVVAQSLGNCR